MKRLCMAMVLLLLLSACGGREETVEGNLILTNYSSESISHITVVCGEETLSSEAAISDTQLCAFTLPEEESLVYTVSFQTEDGETVSESFADIFAEGTAVRLRADQEYGSWRLVYDGTP